MPTSPSSPWPMAVAREARAAPEFAAFMAVAGPLLMRSPRGHGQTVLVLPGLGGSDVSTRPLRWFLDRLGYRTFGWGLGRNRGFGRHVTAGLDSFVARQVDAGSGPVSLVGWSLGGVHAVQLARRHAGHVGAIVTLGSPLAAGAAPPVDVPTTSVYSRSDSVVPWAASVLPVTSRHENVEVTGSHLGLGHNPAALIVVADRLAQQSAAWTPFVAPRWARRWIPLRSPA